MTDFAPPTGPPPPKVPEGWKVVWNDQYSEWFFVNIYTKKSQWDKPTEPVYPPGEAPPDGPPPSYAPAASGAAGGPIGSNPTGASEKSALSSNNPYANISEDEKLARKLQAEEEAQARGGPTRGASNDYYNQPSQPQPNQYGGAGQYGAANQYGGYPQQSASPYPQAQSPMYDAQAQDRGKSKGGLLGKLMGKASGKQSGGSYQQPHYGQQPGYGAPMGGGYGGGYGGQPGYYQQQPGMMGGGKPAKRPGGGLGPGGAMALGAGGGLLGGALLGSAMADAGDHGNTYVENNYGDDGGDFGGDGGDFGGDF